MKEKLKVVVVKPMKPAQIAEIDADLKSMQKIVGGYIETYQLPDALIVCNEDGKLQGLTPNRAILTPTKKIKEIIVGTFFICSENGEDFESLSNELIEKYLKAFQRPDLFWFDVNKCKLVLKRGGFIIHDTL